MTDKDKMIKFAHTENYIKRETERKLTYYIDGEDRFYADTDHENLKDFRERTYDSIYSDLKFLVHLGVLVWDK